MIGRLLSSAAHLQQQLRCSRHAFGSAEMAFDIWLQSCGKACAAVSEQGDIIGVTSQACIVCLSHCFPLQ